MSVFYTTKTSDWNAYFHLKALSITEVVNLCKVADILPLNLPDLGGPESFDMPIHSPPPSSKQCLEKREYPEQRGLILPCQFQWWLPVVQPYSPLAMACGWHKPALSWLIGGCCNDLIETEVEREFQSEAHCPHYYSGREAILFTRTSASSLSRWSALYCLKGSDSGA